MLIRCLMLQMVSQRDVELTFVIVNWEESAVSSVEDDINPDNALLLFEFVEAILRFAAMKFMTVRPLTMDHYVPVTAALLSIRSRAVV